MDGATGNSELLTVKQVAELLTVKPRTVWRLVASQAVKPPVKIGRSSRFLRSELDAYLEAAKAAR